MVPLFNLNNSMKLASLRSSISFLINVGFTWNLSAPGAAKFENPAALSNKSESSNAETTFSSINNPTLYEGLLSYCSTIIVCVDTLTKYPRIKYIPSWTVAADPIEAAPRAMVVAKGLFAITLDIPYSMSEEVIKFSPSLKTFDTKSLPDLVYFTYNVLCPLSDWVDVIWFTTVASTPEISPLIVFPTNLSRYSDIGIPKKVSSNSIAWYCPS